MMEDKHYSTERPRHRRQIAEIAEITGHKHRPDDDPEPGDRCKDGCGPIVWVGPGMDDWTLA